MHIVSVLFLIWHHIALEKIVCSPWFEHHKQNWGQVSDSGESLFNTLFVKFSQYFLMGVVLCVWCSQGFSVMVRQFVCTWVTKNESWFDRQKCSKEFKSYTMTEGWDWFWILLYWGGCNEGSFFVMWVNWFFFMSEEICTRGTYRKYDSYIVIISH